METAPKIGRPKGNTAVSHTQILEATYELLQGMPARDLTMEAVAKRAGVGKPTLYRWWPSKPALILAVFQERFNAMPEEIVGLSAEETIRRKVQRLVQNMNGLFGKVVADLIAEGQSDREILRVLYDDHIRPRKAGTMQDVRNGIELGEFRTGTDPELVVEAIVGPLYYRLLTHAEPLTEEYANALIDLVLGGIRLNSLVSFDPSHD